MGAKNAVPNILTLSNLVSGFLAIYLITEGRPYAASLLIGLGFLFDAMDGVAARLLKVKSKIGVELDSLADSVTFVVAPAFLLAGLFDSIILGLAVGSVVCACGVYRLAKFNVSGSLEFFSGMATPYFAAIAIAVALIDLGLSDPLYALIFIALSYLMVSPVRFPSLKEKEYLRFKYIGLLLIAAILILILIRIELLVIGFLSNVTVWLLVLLPLVWKVKRKHFMAIYLAGLLAITVLSYGDPLQFLFVPLIYMVVFSPLIEYARSG